MQHLEVVIEGICLWIDRGTYWDVLFPRAAQGKASQQHIPLLTGFIGGDTFIDPVPLHESTLDLLHVTPGSAAKHLPGWMLPLDATKHKVPAHGIDASTSAHVFSSVRLPKCQITQLSARLPGPVHYDGKRNFHLDYGTRWTAMVPANACWAIFRDRTTLAETRTEPLIGGGRPVTLLIRNRTQKEHDAPTTIKPTPKGAELTEVKDVHRLLGITDKNAPTYQGDPLARAKVALGPVGATAIVVNTDKLCPGTYLL